MCYVVLTVSLTLLLGLALEMTDGEGTMMSPLKISCDLGVSGLL